MSFNDSQQLSSCGSELQYDPKCEPTSIKKGDKLKITVQIDNGQQSEEEGLQSGASSPPDNVNCAEVSGFLARLRNELLCKVDQQMTNYTQIVCENSTLLENITKTLSRAPNMNELQKRLSLIEGNVSTIQSKVCNLEGAIEELSLTTEPKDEKKCPCSKTSFIKKNKPCPPTCTPKPQGPPPKCPSSCPTTPLPPKPQSEKCSTCQPAKKQSQTGSQQQTSQQKCSC